MQALSLLQIESLVETVDTSTGINQLLLAGIEGMAVAADFHADIGLGGTGLELVTTSALDGGHLIVGMDTLFHFFSPRSRLLLFATAMIPQPIVECKLFFKNKPQKTNKSKPFFGKTLFLSS
mgnify:CR=1 FL=1